VRLKYSDFQRQDNQSLLLLAVRASLLSHAVLPKLPALVQAFHDTVLTDLSLEQFGQAACLLGKVGEGNITLAQLPKGTYTVTKIYSAIQKDTTSIVAAGPQVVAEYLRRFALG
jgi:anionic cell wall polymer biosynthesis LytR-Cps2A-Psr (LCP) family protein